LEPVNTDPALLLQAERDAHRSRQLRRMRTLATGLFVAMAALFLVARGLHGLHPAWGFVEAFAEAAMVGALADWFAVVALFRHPMGVPLWHTAIIPNHKDDIARNLGEFVETHFITVEAVVSRIRDFDPARRLGQWLCFEPNAQRLGTLLAQAARRLLAEMDDQALRALLRDALVRRLSDYDLRPPVAQFAEQLFAEKRHHELLDWALKESVLWLESEAARERIAALVDEALGVENAWLRAVTSVGAERLRDTLKAALVAALEDPEHPLRQRYEAHIREWLVKLRTDEGVAERIRGFQHATLRSPQFTEGVDGVWNDARAWAERDLAQPRSTLAGHAATLALGTGRKLEADADLRQWINDRVLEAATPLVRDNRGKVAAFIQAQIEAWSHTEMSRRIELAVGKDLQFIRINGTLVGGLAGLVLHMLATLG
jgi:uncharacterized membrane-anchored protein YjiN (DUF445 family)